MKRWTISRKGGNAVFSAQTGKMVDPMIIAGTHPGQTEDEALADLAKCEGFGSVAEMFAAHGTDDKPVLTKGDYLFNEAVAEQAEIAANAKRRAAEAWARAEAAVAEAAALKAEAAAHGEVK